MVIQYSYFYSLKSPIFYYIFIWDSQVSDDACDNCNAKHPGWMDLLFRAGSDSFVASGQLGVTFGLCLIVQF